MDEQLIPARRTVIGAGALGLASIASLCACAGAGASTPSMPGASGDAGAGVGAGRGALLLASVPVGGFAAATGPDGRPVIVARPEAGRLVAFSAVCTHMGCQVVPTGTQLACPCHGSAFDGLTGQVLSGPARAPLPAVSVRLKGQQIVVG